MNPYKKTVIDLMPSDLQFTVFSSAEIKKLSVVKIITGLTFDPLGHPYEGGLYDDHMGGYGRLLKVCSTCKSGLTCPGHIGHIELASLLYNPFFIKIAQKILNVSCLHCFKMQFTNHVREITELQLRLVDAGYVIEAQELETYKAESVCFTSGQMIKLETGGSKNPRIIELTELIESDSTNSNSTKTNCETRTAIVNAALQRSSSYKCIHCSKPLITVKYQFRKLVYIMTAADIRSNLQNSSFKTGYLKTIFADECQNYLRQIYENSAKFLDLLFPIMQLFKDTNPNVKSPVDQFFIENLVVTPPKARPAVFADGRIVEHTKTNIYRQIIQNNSVLRVIINHIKGETISSTKEATQIYKNAKGSSEYEKLYNARQELQTSVDGLLDANLTREKISMQGLKQILEKKEGLLRKHMMGKRVDYAARTVITPDPNINVDEIGIPDVFAKKLSYPVPVAPWNVAELRKMVINGPHVHPGANLIQDKKGGLTLIPGGNRSKRESMAKLLFNYPENGINTVHRHVLNGDILLLNRQPSLHKPSIMAHKVRILKGEKTFRLHYSNCKAYNADFDGDEMNAHLPQNEVARAEAYNLVNVASNYLVPKDGTPLGGLIQDHVISGVKLSIRGRFFNREDYHQLVYQGLADKKGNIKLLPPAILKPKMLWSGKQILSTIIINLIPEECPKINMNSYSKIQSKQWQIKNTRNRKFNILSMCESNVCIRNGELLMGVLDKQQYGATTFGLIHCIYELYGGDISTRVLTAFTKVFTSFLQREGFTLGVQDILVTAKCDNLRRKIIQECREEGPNIVATALDLEEIPPLDELEEKMKETYEKDPKFRVVLDRKYKAVLDDYTNRINKVCLPDGLISTFPENNLQLMILSGAKGSLVNAMQISCLLGQIELEGKRPPLMISGKSLPSFAVFETSPKSGGFIDGRFMTGIKPQDFFFHCMAGREGLIDTAVKTSRSGYLQRCLIKHLEGLCINYDLTVRDSDSSVIQFLYGEDGFDILKSKFFSYKSWKEFFLMNSATILDPKTISDIKDEASLLKIKKHAKKLRSRRKINSENKYNAPFTKFSAELRNDVEISNPQKVNSKTGRCRLDEKLIKLWKKADAETKEIYRKKCLHLPDPITSIYKPDLFYGSLPESLQIAIDKIDDAAKKEKLEDLVYVKAMKALASPGEPVGLIAAQSIGEPSTQMTLNTFHFAGRGEMNVTLGIPRLREILMLASANIKTPSMDIPILPTKLSSANKLRLKLNRVTLSDVLQDVEVTVKTVLRPERANQYKLRFQFLPREAYQDEYCVKPKQIIKYVNEVFFKVLFRSLLKSSNNANTVVNIGDGKKKNEDKEDSDGEVVEKKNSNNANNSDYDDENDDDDNDATDIKLKSQKHDETEYDDPDDCDEIADANDDEENLNPVAAANVDDENDDEENDDKNNDETAEKVLKQSFVQDYAYDKINHLWCKLTFHLPVKYMNLDISSILKSLAEKSIIYEAPNIKRSIIYKGENDVQFLKTDGINIVEMFKHNTILNLNRLYANDIHAIANTYGIEAAAHVITKEISNVFKVYGIAVDRRHLSLIADYMTFDGTFKPLSRKGMEYSASPLQQMSFEASLQFLKTATECGRKENFNSPSSRLMAGLPVKNGTGAFELLVDLLKI